MDESRVGVYPWCCGGDERRGKYLVLLGRMREVMLLRLLVREPRDERCVW